MIPLFRLNHKTYEYRIKTRTLGDIVEYTAQCKRGFWGKWISISPYAGTTQPFYYSTIHKAVQDIKNHYDVQPSSYKYDVIELDVTEDGIKNKYI